MIRLIFKNNRAIAYATAGYSSSDEEEVVVEKTEKELNELLAPIIEENEDWTDKYIYLKLDENNNLIVDKEKS